MPAQIQFAKGALKDIRARYLRDHQSCRQIAEDYGVAKNTIRGQLLAMGVVLDKSSSMSAVKAGQPSPRKGATHTAEAKERMSAAAKGNKRCLGRVLSEASKRKMSEARRRFMDAHPERFQASLNTARQVRARNIATIRCLPAPTMTLKRLTATERLLRDRKRSAYKRLLRRLITHKGYRKQSRSEEVLGYTQAQFVAHIERQFEQGMAWGLIHVDHIVPIAAFFDAGIDDPKIINALANLRPMWPKPNQQKSDKYNRRNFAADLDHIMRGLV